MVEKLILTTFRKSRFMMVRVAPYVIVWVVNVAIILFLGGLLFSLVFLLSNLGYGR